MMLFKGFHLKREEGGSTTRPCMKDFAAVAIPIFHSRREAWMFLRGWSNSMTTQQLRRDGYRCVEVKVVPEDQSTLEVAHKILGDIYFDETGWRVRLKAYMEKYGR